MKNIKSVGLVLALVALSPILISLLVLALVFLLFYCLGMAVRGIIAQTTLNGLHHRLLRQLHEIGSPPSELELQSLEDWYIHHDHANCTPRTCGLKQAEEYWQLTEECREVHVPTWRVRWAV